MGDSTEELEPLFDYRRVQPVNCISLDEDDLDSCPAFVPKRRKLTKPAENKGDEDDEGKTAPIINCEEFDDEEDWLPPPPKNTAPATKREEDSAIKELRIKKQELASLVQSAENALRASEELAKRAAAISSNAEVDQSSPERTEEPSKPASNRAKIDISFQDKSETKQYRIYADDKFEQLFKKHAQKAKIDLEKLVFKFDGDKIDPQSTPMTLGMEDGDIIEVYVKPN